MRTAPLRFHWKTVLLMGAVTGVLMLVISLPLSAVTGWPSWVVSAVAGGISGVTAPFITQRVMARRERTRATASEATDR